MSLQIVHAEGAPYLDLVVSGRATDVDLSRYLHGSATDRCDADIRVLVDLTELDASALSANGVRGGAMRHFGASHLRVALLAPSDSVYGLCRMFVAHVNAESEGEVMTFRSRSAAREWLLADDSDGCDLVSTAAEISHPHRDRIVAPQHR